MTDKIRDVFYRRAGEEYTEYCARLIQELINLTEGGELEIDIRTAYIGNDYCEITYVSTERDCDEYDDE